MKNGKPSYLFPLSLVFYEIATYLAIDMYLPALPSLEKDFQISRQMTQYTVLMSFLGASSMQLFMGPLSDRYGRKIVVLMGGLSFIIASFLCATTENIMVMLVARFIQGSAICSAVVAGYSAVHELYDTKMAIKVTAVMGSVTILAPAFGPLLGALVLKFSGWRAIFWILTLWALIAILLLSKVMPRTNKESVPLHFKSILSDYFTIITRKDFLAFILPFCLLFMTFIFWGVGSPFLVIEHYQKTPTVYSILQSLVFGCFILGTQVTRILINRLSPQQIIYIGFTIASGCVFFILSSQLYIMVMGMMIFALGASIAFGPLNRCAIDTCHEPMGRRMAIGSSLMSAFGVIAAYLVTLMNLHWLILSGFILATTTFFILKRKS